jgi:thiazole synthase/sulfur carrier protein
MTIMVNKRPVEFVEGETVKGLIRRMNYTFPLLVVKVDGKLVPNPEQKDHEIRDGSDIDIIHLPP